MRFGIDMNTDHTLEEVGKQFDVTRERIRQIEAKALRKLRHQAAPKCCAASWTTKSGCRTKQNPGLPGFYALNTPRHIIATPGTARDSWR